MTAWTTAEAYRRREARHAAAMTMIQRNPGKGTSLRDEQAYRDAVQAFEEVPKSLRDVANTQFERAHVCNANTCPLGKRR